MQEHPLSPKVAIAAEFFNSFIKLPKVQQDKAVRFMAQFQSDPQSPGINYEKIKVARDKSLRSVRIDQTYRAIISAPDQGNVYILLWADKHDDAYDWAKNKVLKVNPENGVLQFIETKYLDEAERIQKNVNDLKNGLFNDVKDRHLVRLGVPVDLIPLVRQVQNLSDVEVLKIKLPDEAYEALSLLADGENLDEILTLYDVQQQPIDTEDFATALANPESQRRFVLASDDEAVQRMLDAPLEKWRVFLHPLQRKLVFRDWNGPVRVLGGAGTGKTVAAIHRAKWLAEQLSPDSGEKILLTTYTKNLALDIEQNLKNICSDSVMHKIEVVNLDAWVKQFLNSHGESHQLAFNNKQRNDLWNQALRLKPSFLDLPNSFYREEWEKIIQPQNLTTENAYLRARRVGRGVRVDRAMRKAIWPVFEAYRKSLDQSGLREIEDTYRDAINLIESKHINRPYAAVVVDEAQDFGPNAFKLIRQMVQPGANDLFIVGDPHQRIYGNRVVLSQCDIKIVGRSYKLRVNYRTPEQIRQKAIEILDNMTFDDLDKGTDEQKGYRSLIDGVAPHIQCFTHANQEINYVVSALRSMMPEELAKTCLTVRRMVDMERYSMAFSEAGIKYYQMDHNTLDDIDGSFPFGVAN